MEMQLPLSPDYKMLTDIWALLVQQACYVFQNQ